MSKVIAFTCLHYGKPYLAWAMRSLIDYVDEYVVIYSDVGSHGHRSEVSCPETRDELHAIAQQAAGDKLRWHEGRFATEGEQRDHVFKVAPDAAVIFVADYDEIWPAAMVQSVLDYAFTVTNSIPPFRAIRTPMVHAWRSFNRMILHDPAYPTRVIFPRIDAKYGENTWSDRHGHIVHLGYAIPPYLMDYKWKIHGHKNELRRDVDWFNEVYMNEERRTDLHPVGSDFWNWETVNPLDYMPLWMAEHKYYGLEVIE